VIVNPTEEMIEDEETPEKTMEEKSRHFMKIFKPSPNGMDDKWYLTLMDQQNDVRCFAEMCTQSIVFLMGGDYVIPRDGEKNATIVVDGKVVPKYLPEFSVKSQHYPVPACEGRAVGQCTSYGDFLIQCLKPESKAGKKHGKIDGEGKGEGKLPKAYPNSRFVLDTYRSSYKHNLVLLDYIHCMSDVKDHKMNQLEWQKMHGRGYEYTTETKRGPYHRLLKPIMKLCSCKPPMNAIIGDYRLLAGNWSRNCGYGIAERGVIVLRTGGPLKTAKIVNDPADSSPHGVLKLEQIEGLNNMMRHLPCCGDLGIFSVDKSDDPDMDMDKPDGDHPDVDKVSMGIEMNTGDLSVRLGKLVEAKLGVDGAKGRNGLSTNNIMIPCNEKVGCKQMLVWQTEPTEVNGYKKILKVWELIMIWCIVLMNWQRI
jgi:hypothetical protein